MKCSECEETVKNLYEDPHTPPLALEPCLCGDCYLDAAHEVIEELNERVSHLELDMIFVRRENSRES